MQRVLAASRLWLSILVVVALLVPAGAFLVDEFEFRRSADGVVATLEGELAGADAARTVLLVRSLGCSGRAGSGTAFVIDTPAGPALLTNRHVVDDARTVGVRQLDGGTEIRVDRVLLSDAADVAVLEVTDPAALPPPLALAAGTPTLGEQVRLVGFPAATPFTAAGTVDEVQGGRLLLDLDVSAGASGSPVVADDGRVVGQVYAVTADGRGVATPAARLLTAIDDLTPAPDC
jgi:S1-C subfamily serine protease